MDHFEIDIAGEIADLLSPQTQIRIVRNPERHRSIDSVHSLSDLPAKIPAHYSSTGCVAEFWCADSNKSDQLLFSVVVDKELFDEFRVITLRLDRPTPELKPEYDYWAVQAWSPNITRRMRYRELPWFNTATNQFEPMPRQPEMMVTLASTGEILETCPLAKEVCRLDYRFGDFTGSSRTRFKRGEEIVFSVNYTSNIFKPIDTQHVVSFDPGKHKIYD